MSKENNLTDFLTDVADAIREKKGTTEKINPQNFSEEIKNLPSGSIEVEEKDVNFYDYDGTLLFSYTIPEAQALTELPTPKGHSGLIFDGWNWDYEDVIALDYPMNIGAMYRTDDGKTRLYLKVEEPTSISLSFKNNDTGTVTVDFGDGEVVETSEATPVLPHRYDVGEYVLRIDGTKCEFITDEGTRNILGFFAAKSSGLIRKVEIGERCRVSGGAFKACYNMETITFPSVIASAGWSQTYFSAGLKHFNLPKGCSIYVGGCKSTPKLRMICLPSKPKHLSSTFVSYSAISKLAIPDDFVGLASVDNTNLQTLKWPTASVLPNNAFLRCLHIEEIVIPDNIISLPQGMFNDCRCLRKVNMPNALEIINNSAFNGCVSIFNLPPFPSTLKTIGASAFSYMTPRQFDFSACAQVPTLNNANAFNYTSGKIVVPDALYDEWIAATNWSTYADRIVKASEYQPTTE